MDPEDRSRSFLEQLTRSEYLLFQQLIGGAAGLRIGEGDWGPLRAALCERVSAGGLRGFGEYYDLLRSSKGATEMNRLVELLTVHETAFFRNRSHFQVLSGAVIPELIGVNEDSKSIRIWSAGCSTGQEPYSIAITLLESIPDAANWRIEVLATDISERALDVAREGTYPERALLDVDPTLLDRYFERSVNGYRVGPAARRLVRFEHLNLVKEPFPMASLRPCDVIVCENVTIYFKIESTRRVIRNFFDTLRPGGYLFLGYSETLWEISDDFVLKEMGNAFVYRKPDRLCPEQPPAPREGGLIAGVQSTVPRPRPRTSWHRHKAVRLSSIPVRKTTLAEAEDFYEARRFEESLLAVESVLAEHPSDARAHLLAAKLRADREESGSALRHLHKALEADPLAEEGHYLMGVLLLRAGENQAADSLSKVIYLNPSGHRSALAHFQLGGMYFDQGDCARSAREYRSALKTLERFPKDELIGEFSADFLARVCRRRLEDIQ